MNTILYVQADPQGWLGKSNKVAAKRIWSTIQSRLLDRRCPVHILKKCYVEMISFVSPLCKTATVFPDIVSEFKSN